MKGLFIPEITVEMFRNGCLESIEALMAEGEIYDIEYEPERKGKWVLTADGYHCSQCNHKLQTTGIPMYCPNCGAKMEGRGEEK